MLLRFLDPQTGAFTIDCLESRETCPSECPARFRNGLDGGFLTSKPGRIGLLGGQTEFRIKQTGAPKQTQAMDQANQALTQQHRRVGKRVADTRRLYHAGYRRCAPGQRAQRIRA